MINKNEKASKKQSTSQIEKTTSSKSVYIHNTAYKEREISVKKKKSDFHVSNNILYQKPPSNLLIQNIDNKEVKSNHYLNSQFTKNSTQKNQTIRGETIRNTCDVIKNKEKINTLELKSYLPDFFSQNFTLESNRNKNFSTLPTVVASMIVVILTIILSITNIREFISKNNPHITSQKVNSSKILTLSDFPLFFSFINQEGNDLTVSENPNYFINITISKTVYSESYIKTNTYYKNFKFAYCEEAISTDPKVIQSYSENINRDGTNLSSGLMKNAFFEEFNNIFNSVKSKRVKMFCLREDNETGDSSNYLGFSKLGSLSFNDEIHSYNSSYIKLSIGIKDNSTRTTQFNSIDNQLLTRNRENVVSSNNLIVTYFDNFFNLEDNIKPVYYKANSLAVPLFTNIHFSKHFTISLNNILTNDGLLFNSFSTQNYYENKMSSNLIYNTLNESYSDLSLFSLTISSKFSNTKIIRSYSSLSEVLAKIISIFLSLFFVFRLFLQNFIRFSYYRTLFKHFITITD